ncbi:MAG TPA: glycine cleavage system protein GcvH [Isosphaeraceae bacterium]
MDPQSLKFTSTHEWVAIAGDEATIGITRFAVEQLTDLLLIDLGRAGVGTRLTAGQEFGEIESVKSVSDLYCPVAGEVIAVNPAVADDVQVLARDPYGEGWLIKVRLSDPTAPISGLMDHQTYQRTVADSSH